MPLKTGSSQKTISENIGEMMRSETFAEGKSRKKKLQMAQAAAYSEAGKSRKKKKRKRKNNPHPRSLVKDAIRGACK